MGAFSGLRVPFPPRQRWEPGPKIFGAIPAPPAAEPVTVDPAWPDSRVDALKFIKNHLGFLPEKGHKKEDYGKQLQPPQQHQKTKEKLDSSGQVREIIYRTHTANGRAYIA